MANVVVGSLVANELVPIASHAAGSLNFGPLNIPQGFTVLMIAFDLRQVDSLTATFSSTVELSLDNGANWIAAGGNALNLAQSGYVLNGGVLTRSNVDPMGPGPVRMFAKQIILKNSDLTTRQVRGTLSVTEALISGVTFAGW